MGNVDVAGDVKIIKYVPSRPQELEGLCLLTVISRLSDPERGQTALSFAT